MNIFHVYGKLEWFQPSLIVSGGFFYALESEKRLHATRQPLNYEKNTLSVISNGLSSG
jgi:hypothetical protein